MTTKHTEPKPHWPFKTSFALAEWLCQHYVVKIEKKTKYIGENEVQETLHLYAANGESRIVSPELFSDWELTFSPGWGSLVSVRIGMVDHVRAMQKWKEKTAADYAEYQRLRGIFEGVE